MGSSERAQVIDDLVTQVIEEHAAGMWFSCYVDLLTWNENSNDGIISGMETLFNSRNEKYFYPIDFGPSSPPAESKAIPGYPFAALIAISFLMLNEKRKQIQK